MPAFLLWCFLGSLAFGRSPLHPPSAMSPDQRYLRWTTRLGGPPLGVDYKSRKQVHQAIAPLVAERPGVIVPFKIGRTVNRNPIWAFRIHKPGTTPKKKVLVFAGIHALEWITTETATRFVTWIARHPVDDVEVVVVPLLNPDGRLRVEADLAAGRNRYRRGNGRQVDLNRDFEINRTPKAIWRHLLPGYYGHTKAPLSQPESRALDRLLEERFDVAVSLHSFGGFIYTPWSGLWERPADFGELHRLGTIMSAAQGAHAYRVRQLSRWGFFFRAHGSEIDHIYGKFGTLAFLVELSRSGLHPLKPSTFEHYFRWYNPARPEPHVDRGLSALRALVHTLGWEARTPAGG